jgi:hypothetical protein
LVDTAGDVLGHHRLDLAVDLELDDVGTRIRRERGGHRTGAKTHPSEDQPPPGGP